jgi:hypothetical protein
MNGCGAKDELAMDISHDETSVHWCRLNTVSCIAVDTRG